MKRAAVAVACVVVFLWKYWSLSLDYTHELDAHLQTQKQLTIALAEAQRWQTVAGETLTSAESQKQPPRRHKKVLQNLCPWKTRKPCGNCWGSPHE